MAPLDLAEIVQLLPTITGGVKGLVDFIQKRAGHLDQQGLLLVSNLALLQQNEALCEAVREQNRRTDQGLRILQKQARSLAKMCEGIAVLLERSTSEDA